MISRKTALTLVVLGFGFATHAAPVKYLVKFKSPETFQTVAQSHKAQSFARAFGQVQPMRLFNTNASVNQALEHVQLLIVESDDAAAMESLKRHPAIELVEREIIHPAPKVMLTKAAPGNVRTMAANDRIDRPWGIDSVKAPGAWAVTQGEGARVMVLDTGLDGDHPAIRNNFEAGKNFTGNANDFRDDVGHGTHVSGTVLGEGTGVAPKAKLLMGKVCTTMGCPSTAIASGINWAVSQRVHVVNMSLGGMFISSAEKAAIAAAESAGVFIAAATGNDGQPRVSFPAAIDSIAAVGAIDITNKKADFSNWGPELDVMGPGVDVNSSVPRGTGRGSDAKLDIGKGLEIAKSAPFVGSPLKRIQGSLVFAGLGKTTDVASLDLSGKIALISRGEIPFKEKVANVLAKGAIAAVIFNNAPGLIQGSLTEDGSEAAIPAIMIEQTLGEEAKAYLASGATATASMAIVATDYASFQGTSMATPHVAGVAALVRAANPRLTPLQVRELLKSTATALGPNNGNEYGKGLVNAEAAVQKAIVSAPVMALAN